MVLEIDSLLSPPSALLMSEEADQEMPSTIMQM